MAVIVTMLTGCVSSRPAKPAQPPGPPVLAFVRAGELMLASADGRTWRAAQLTLPSDQLVWSPDGTRLAWLDDPQRYGVDGSLHILDVASRQEASQPCPCRGVGFLGTEVATLSADGTALLLFPPSGNPRRVALDRPKPPSSKVVASGRDRVAVAIPLPEQQVGVRGQSYLATIDHGGRTTRLLRPGAMTSFWEASGAPDGRQLAWVDQATGGACWNEASLPTLRYRGDRTIRLDVPTDPTFHRAVLTDQRLITSYAWAGPGLTVTFGPGHGCQPVYRSRLVSYYREGSRWTLLGTGWIGVGFGRDGRVATLEASDPVKVGGDDLDQAMIGRLVLRDASGSEKPLADDVSSFAFTPAEAAAARPPAGLPPPSGKASEPALPKTDDHGRPLSGPLYDLAGRIMAAAAAGDVSGLLRLCHACGQETVSWLRSPEGPEQVLRSLQTHPGRDNHDLVFPGLARRPCVDDAGKKLTCTEAQIQDVAMLNLRSKSALNVGDRTYRAPKSISIHLRPDDAGNARWVGHLPGPRATSGDKCPTPQEFVDAMQRIPGYFKGAIGPGDQVVCAGSMAVSLVTLDGALAHIVLVRSEGGWNGTNFKGGTHSREECAGLPPTIRVFVIDSCD
jgi:hypothetical protein